ncbi:MEKHLA domain-containing protein [Rhizobium ruizarguesonis]|uniref:MEKHLA domain-containing protein n=1 Tax=Rhizobium ruizarguesonis TaxID=2081791 RepID=UPI00036B14AB|nr:MEKHLA domain-containing protein [Rhizobium ruizarguesonis]TAZ70043.1 MEKHLA domain-containing protein [Rhizobium ruizarguesonis]TAZ92894.1 MEKHLA domain-containing protein [Rhizobium ruizarguesonis]TBA11521.1 MEKHLA domain-containing protein [Rhizobium ruizarguesonis]TBA35436.1 MEKHLA domain-containing protein [Rhizobium ruizarguesonis]TBA54816.1 MEKHLA domain-containing protein [Rhizobium ruizarguesonis]
MIANYNDAGLDLSYDLEFYALMEDSFERSVGRRLTPEGRSAEWLYDQSPAVVLAHNTAADPRFIYANRAAQACFEYSWDEFITLPSRLSAEAPDRAERDRLLNAVTTNGFIADYRGLRIAKSGRRFYIENAIVWDLVDRNGCRRGQAATFDSWRDVQAD